MSIPQALKPLAVALALATASMAASATLTVVTSKAAFAGMFVTTGTDTFNDLSNGQIPDPGPLSRSAGSFGYMVDTEDHSLWGAGNFNGWLSNNVASNSLVFTGFDSSVQGAGGRFFGTDINGQFQAGASVTVTATDADGSETFTITNATRRSFVGFVSDSQLLSLTVTTDQGGGPVWGTVNNLILAAVPEPETYAMLLAGLAAIGFVARRRKH